MESHRCGASRFSMTPHSHAPQECGASLRQTEVSGHFGGLDGLEEKLAFEDFRNEQDGERSPGVEEGYGNGEQCAGDAGKQDVAERSTLKSGAVLVGRPIGFLGVSEEEEFGEEFEDDDDGKQGRMTDGGEGSDGAEKTCGTSTEAPEGAVGIVIDHHAGKDGEQT